MKIFSLLIFLVCTCLCKVQAQSKTDIWTVKADSINPEAYYGATVANGMVGIVSAAYPLRMERVVLNGVYDTYGRSRVSRIMKGFNFTSVNLSIDGDRVDENNISALTQQLDMKKAVIRSRFSIPGKATITYSVRALRQLPFTSLIDVEIKPQKDVSIDVKSMIEAPSILHQVQNKMVHAGGIALLTSMGRSPTGKHTLAACNAFVFDEEKGPKVTHSDTSDTTNSAGFTKQLQKGETYYFTVINSQTSTEHFANPASEAKRLTIFAALQGRDKLIEDHISAWKKMWSSRISVEGNFSDQQDINFALYNLYSFIRKGTAYSLSPMGLSGFGYNGHIFWDAETWMFPPLLVLHPEIARSMLDYRYNRLNAAKQKAAANGYEGAMYPWESADTGQEATPVWALTGPFEQHITADIAIACWNYFRVTNDVEWLKQKGYSIMKAAANFWVSRVEKGADGKYHINNVVGADEYAVHVADDAFTNGAAKKALIFATEAAQKVGVEPNPHWQQVAENIVIHSFDNGVTKEHASYTGQKIKQADVNLLSYPLNIITGAGQIEKNLTYYEPKVGQGPAMSYSMFALLWSRLGNADKAYQLFYKGYKPNEVPPFGVLAESAGGSNPYFATGAGGMLQAVLFGFGGLEITDDGIIQTESVLPDEWRTLKIQGVGLKNKTYIRR